MNAIGDDAKVSVLHTSTLSFKGTAVPLIETSNVVVAGVVAVANRLPVTINGVVYSILLSA